MREDLRPDLDRLADVRRQRPRRRGEGVKLLWCDRGRLRRHCPLSLRVSTAGRYESGLRRRSHPFRRAQARARSRRRSPPSPRCRRSRIRSPSAPTSLITIASRRLRSSFSRPYAIAPSPVSAANPTSTCPGRRLADSVPSTSIVGSSSSAGGPAFFLSLAAAGRARSEVGDRRRHQQHVGGVKARLARVQQFGRRLHGDDTDAGGRRQRDIGRDDRHVGAAAGGRRGQRQSHPSRGAVADVPDGVDRLTRAAGGDEHANAGPTAAADRRQRPLAGGDQFLRLGHPAGSVFAVGGQLAGVGPDCLHPPRAQQREVVLGRRMRVHPIVHRRAPRSPDSLPRAPRS